MLGRKGRGGPGGPDPRLGSGDSPLTVASASAAQALADRTSPMPPPPPPPIGLARVRRWPRGGRSSMATPDPPSLRQRLLGPGERWRPAPGDRWLCRPLSPPSAVADLLGDRADRVAGHRV